MLSRAAEQRAMNLGRRTMRMWAGDLSANWSASSESNARRCGLSAVERYHWRAVDRLTVTTHDKFECLLIREEADANRYLGKDEVAHGSGLQYSLMIAGMPASISWSLGVCAHCHSFDSEPDAPTTCGKNRELCQQPLVKRRSERLDDTLAAAWPVSFAIVTKAGELRIPSG
jgi:hypothetical protein